MNLFGAATSGVDPQTGSYLSKEQRVAMFRASQGRGGSGGASKPGSGPRVSPQSSIVVVNKLSQISKTLETNFASATQNVSEQVAKNRKGVEDLYNFVYLQQRQELKDEKVDTKKKTLEAQNMRFRMRENLIEGVASATAGAINAAKNVADAAGRPIMSFLERLKNAMLLLAGAWLIRNLPTILDKIENLFVDFEGVKRELFKQIINQRGWAAGVGRLINVLYKGLSKIISGVFRFAQWIGTKVTQLIRKIFTSVRSFAVKVFNAVKRVMQKPLQFLLSKAKQFIPKPVKEAFTTIRNTAGKALNSAKSTLSGAFGALTGKGGREGGKKGGAAGLKQLIGPALRNLGLNASRANALISKLASAPVIGSAIDIALNLGSGMGWMDSLINGLATGMSGAIGWKAGGAAGAFIGQMVIPIPGVGAAIGGALGSVIGSIAAANIAEMGLNKGREALGMDPVTRGQFSTEQANEIYDKGEGFFNNLFNAGKEGEIPKPERRQYTGEEATNLIKLGKSDFPTTFDGLSTPEGMSMPDGFGTTINMESIDLPTQTTRLKPEREEPAQVRAEEAPALSATDSEMDFYRSMSLEQYQLAY